MNFITLKLQRARKLLFLGALLQVGLIGAQFESLSYDTGQARVFEVMYRGSGGIEASNKKILFCETKNLAHDLNVAEISARFGCKTRMGKAFIQFFLEKIVSPNDQSCTIQNRQKLIQLFIENPDLQEKFSQLMEQAVEHEIIVMKFMQKRFVIDPNGNPIKFIQQYLDKYSAWQAYNLLMKGMTVRYGIPDFISECGTKTSNFYNLSLNQKALAVGLGIFGLNRKYKFEFSGYKTMQLGYGVLTAGYGLYSHYIDALEIRNSLYSLNRLIDIAEQIEQVCHEHGVEHQFKLSFIRSQAGMELLEGLRKDRYKEKDSYFIITPFIHTFIYDVYENDMELSPVYASIAEMDAYIAIAKKMIDLQAADHRFCFAEFLHDGQSKIYAKDFWNVLVSKGDVVTNNIFEDKNIILTGSNEGGKTTAIRAILQNIVLAQTFGIAAASEFKLTQFDVVHSYLNIADDILQGRSRFASELKQAQDILNRIKALGQDEKFFFAFDELFTGTNGEDGAECAYRFIDNVASYKGIQFIYATHFNRLKTIGAHNPACVNYKIEAPLRDVNGQFIRDEKGQLIYPYKLSPGANDINVAMDRARDAGIFA